MAFMFQGNRNARMASVSTLSWDYITGKPGIVLYDPQSLTSDQKRQARENIGALYSVNVKDYGAQGDGVADDTSAISAAIDAASLVGGGEVFFPAGVYKAYITKSGNNNISIRGSERGSTSIKRAGNGHVVTLDDCSFWEFRDIAIQHSSGLTGDGIRFTGNSSSNYIGRCYITGNPDNGVSFVGTLGEQQSGNAVIDSIFLDNEGDQVYFEYSNDYFVERNSIGISSGFGSNPSTGARFVNSSQGFYDGNVHWDNTNAAVFYTCTGARFGSNRFEESVREGLVLDGCLLAQLGTVFAHTNGKGSIGSYPQVRLTNTTETSIGALSTYSWDSGVTQSTYALQCTGTCDQITLGFLETRDNTVGSVDFGSTTNYGRIQRNFVSIGADTSITAIGLEIKNPNSTSFAGAGNDYFVNDVRTARILSQRYASGGNYIIQVADSGGTLQSRLTIDTNGDATGLNSITLPNTGLHLLDTNASHDLIIAPGTNLSADRTLTLTTGDSDRTITISGNPTLSDWFDQSVKTTASPTFAGLTTNGAATIGGLLTVQRADQSTFSTDNTQTADWSANLFQWRTGGSVRAQMNVQKVGATAAGQVYFQPFDTGGSAVNTLFIDYLGNVVSGPWAAIATNATNGFLYVPSCAGTPTGAPTSFTGKIPLVVDSTNNKLYFYSGGSWRDAGP